MFFSLKDLKLGIALITAGLIAIVFALHLKGETVANLQQDTVGGELIEKKIEPIEALPTYELRRVQSEVDNFSIEIPATWEVTEREGSLYLTMPREDNTMRYTPDLVISSFSFPTSTMGSDAIIKAAGIHPLDIISTSTRDTTIYVEASGYNSYNLIFVPQSATRGVMLSSGNSAFINSPDTNKIIQSFRTEQ